jgi:hypothetical protein
MSLEAVALFALALALPLGLVVEYFQWSRWIFGKSAGDEPSLLRFGWLAVGAFGIFKVAAWIHEVLVPRDPSYFVTRFAYFLVATLAIGFAFYAAREVGHFARAMKRK